MIPRATGTMLEVHRKCCVRCQLQKPCDRRTELEGEGMIFPANLTHQVQAILDQDWRGTQRPLNFNEIEELFRYRLGYWLDPTALQEIIEELEVAEWLIYAVIDDKICHVPASAEASLREMQAAYRTGQRGRIEIIA